MQINHYHPSTMLLRQRKQEDNKTKAIMYSEFHLSPNVRHPRKQI